MRNIYYIFCSAAWLLYGAVALFVFNSTEGAFLGVCLASLWGIAGTVVYDLKKDKV